MFKHCEICNAPMSPSSEYNVCEGCIDYSILDDIELEELIDEEIKENNDVEE